MQVHQKAILSLKHFLKNKTLCHPIDHQFKYRLFRLEFIFKTYRGNYLKFVQIFKHLIMYIHLIINDFIPLVGMAMPYNFLLLY